MGSDRHFPLLKRRALLKAAAMASLLGCMPHLARADAGRKMKIGIIGSGQVGGALGSVWVDAGHMVMFSSRDLEHDKEHDTQPKHEARSCEA